MSSLLYRLGRWCADHAWRTLAIWLVVLVGVGALAGTVGKPLTSQISIPGTQFEKVLDRLGAEIPEAAGGAGTVVLESTDGSPITDEQRAAAADVFATWAEVPHVKRVNDPFSAQEQLDRSATDVEAAAKELSDGQEQLDAGREQLAQGQGQLAGGEALVAQLEANTPDDPSLPALREQVSAGRAQVEEAAAQLEQSQAELTAGRAQYEDGKAIAAATSATRLVSEDGRHAVVQVQFDDNAQSVPVDDRALIPERGDPALAAAGLTAHYSVEITQDTSLVGPGEVLGLTVALLVLVVMLGSLIAAGLPLLVALLGVGVGLAGAVAFTVFTDLNTMTPSLALMLGLAVGIDYALFIVNRHRGNILRGEELHESIARSVATAGSAVVFAGATVVIALAALVLSGLPILAQMGLVAAATVAVTVLVAVTVSPAVLALMRARVVSRRGWRAHGFTVPGDPTSRTTGDEREEEHGGWYVGLVTRHPWLTVLAVVGILGVAAVPVSQIQLGLPDGGSEATGTSAHTAYTRIADEFGPGVNGPIIAVATLPEQAAARTDADVLDAQARIATDLRGVDGVRSVLPFGVSEDRTTLAFQVVPTTGPADPATTETVQAIHFSADTYARHTGTDIGLTGQTVANIEISERLAAALPGYLLVVVGLSLVILMLVFRSVVVPIIATAGFLLSVGAAFGVTVAVHQWGWLGGLFGVNQPGPLLSFMPIILIGVLFGLAMDYQMFLVSGMHEARSHGEDSRTAVRTGFVHGAKVVTAAAIIMTSVFLGFAFSHLVMVRAIGFGLAVGVLIDAVLVRMTLTPAVMHLLGDRAWYIPRWLDRVLPDLDVEGVRLAERLESGALGTGLTRPAPADEADAVARTESEDKVTIP
ncbi:MAG TPA: MMPL family transporter [Ornithinibacter sp.]|nr:MMPL family transporter [Ornithinibacter sp.]